VVWVTIPTALTALELVRCSEIGNPINTLSPSDSPVSVRYGVTNIFEDLIYALRNSFSGPYSNPFYDVHFFPYDWRLSCTLAGARLEGFINARSYKKVILVAHSLGGLVASSYLARSAANRSKVEKFITVGVPYLGSPKMVYVMETGNMFLDFLNIQMEFLKSIINNMPAAYQMFPPERNFENYINKNGAMLDGYAATTSFLKTRGWCKKADNTPKSMITDAASYHANLANAGVSITGFNGVNTYKIYGNGTYTVSTVRYDANGNYDNADYTSDGDGTVLSRSAWGGYNGSNTFKVPYVNHTDLIRTSAGIQKIIDVINGVATMSASQRHAEFNEKGWLIGPEYEHLNKAISVLVGGGPFNIATSQGEPVVEEYDTLYKIKADGSREVVGAMNIAGGDHEKQYFLVNDEYTFVKTGVVAPDGKSSAETKPMSFRIDYYDSGYLKKKIEYEKLDIPMANLLIRDHSVKETVCHIDKTSGVIEPTTLVTGVDLNSR
jgi:pimeloyl-ACP methyl ester carboxylesterase